jgi:protein disulfide-isomerase
MQLTLKLNGNFQLDASFIASEDDNMVEHLAEKYRKDKTWAHK